MLWRKDKLFCEMNPLFYAISVKKEEYKRRVRDLRDSKMFAGGVVDHELPNSVSSQSNHLIKRGAGIDPLLQTNKADNIALASATMNGLIVRPGEVFSFWNRVGNVSERAGFKDGRVLHKGELVAGIGGGLCNLANTIHLLVLHSPLDVVEFHSHSDALAPDGDHRVPLSSGTSVYYNYVDYRFKNNTDQDVQLLLWTADDELHGELRSEREFPCRYRLVEEDHHFRKEGEKYYRRSKIFREAIDRVSEDVVDRQLVLDNHSEVMYDYALVPSELIRE